MESFKFICSMCGNQFTSDTDRHYQCPQCNYHQLVVMFTEDGNIYNQKQYERIQSNYESDIKHLMKCTECSSEYQFYDFEYLRCHCGGVLQESYEPQDMIAKLKAYRKQKKLTQEKLAIKLGIPRSTLANIESGRTELPQKVLDFIRKRC